MHVLSQEGSERNFLLEETKDDKKGKNHSRDIPPQALFGVDTLVCKMKKPSRK